MQSAFRQARGLTLLEIIISLTILVIVFVVSFSLYTAAIQTTKRGRTTGEIQQFVLKLNDFKADYGFLPPSTFIEYEPPLEPGESGKYPADPTHPDYARSSRVLFLALTGRTSYFRRTTDRTYLEPDANQIAEPDAADYDLDASYRKTYEEEPFEAGSYFTDPWENSYGYYYDPENPTQKSAHSPWTYDIWSTAGERESRRHRWVGSWKTER